MTDLDKDFLFCLYASTRAEEQALVGWDDQQWETFLRMQFTLQQSQFQQNYPTASFDIVMFGQVSSGRLYVDRREHEIRLIDIALLPTCRGKGVGSQLLRELITEAEERQALLSLHVERHNPARRLYERLGWVETADRGVYLRMDREPATSNAKSEKGSEIQPC